MLRLILHTHTGDSQMSIISIVSTIVGFFGKIPAIGAALSVLVEASLALIVLVNAFVAAWHGVIVILNAFAAIPGLSGLSSVANSLAVDEKIVDDFAQNKILPILNQISAIPLPKLKKV
jgi:hypothetical protein